MEIVKFSICSTKSLASLNLDLTLAMMQKPYSCDKINYLVLSAN